jgi:hypothetical protein
MLRSSSDYDFEAIQDGIDNIFPCEIDVDSIMEPLSLFFVAFKQFKSFEQVPPLVIFVHPDSFEDMELYPNLFDANQAIIFSKTEIVLLEDIDKGQLIITTKEVAKLLSRGRRPSRWTRFPVVLIENFPEYQNQIKIIMSRLPEDEDDDQ